MDKLDLFILSCAGKKVLLPTQMLRYILPFAPLMIASETLDCVIGNLIIQNQKLSVVQLFHEGTTEPTLLAGSGARLIWVNAVNQSKKVTGYALVSDRDLEYLTITKEDIIHEEIANVPYMAYRVDIQNSDTNGVISAFIPDLRQLEADLERV